MSAVFNTVREWMSISLAVKSTITHRIHGAAIYGNMDPINIPPMLAYIPYMDPMGNDIPSGNLT